MEFHLVKLIIRYIYSCVGDKIDMSREELKVLKGNKPIENVNFGDKKFK